MPGGYSHKWGSQRFFFWSHPLGPWSEVKYHFISITKSISMNFIPNFVCVLTNERYKTYQMGFSFCGWIMPQGWDFGGAQVVKKNFFFKHGHVAYQINEDDKQNRMQVKFSS